jgi:hypothetical protein
VKVSFFNLCSLFPKQHIFLEVLQDSIICPVKSSFEDEEGCGAAVE